MFVVSGLDMVKSAIYEFEQPFEGGKDLGGAVGLVRGGSDVLSWYS